VDVRHNRAGGAVAWRPFERTEHAEVFQMERKALMKEMTAREDQAAKLAESPEMADAFAELSKNPDLRGEAERDPAGFLGSRGVDVPKGLAINFLPPPKRGKPVPDYQFFTIRLTRCRKYWVSTKDEEGRITGYEQVEVCFGFEFFPHPLPGGPIA
jgi:hypothetical protein